MKSLDDARGGTCPLCPSICPVLRANCTKRSSSCSLRGQLGESSGQRAAQTGDGKKKHWILRFGRAKARLVFFVSPLQPFSKKKKHQHPRFFTAKMARSSVFAFIGVCLAVVAAGSSSVSGKGMKGFEIATEEIALRAREREERPPRHALSFPFCSPQPFSSSSSSILLSNSSKTAAPARSLLEKAGGEGK